MSVRSRALRPVTMLSVLALLSGCSAGGDEATRAARAREAAKPGWTLSVEDGGATHTLPLERMDVFVSEDETEPEIFEIRGEGVTLVGQIPAAHAVGYGEEFQKLVGQAVPVLADGGDPREPKRSSVRLGALASPVLGGTLRVERVSGRWSGNEGDITLHGTLELRVPTADGERPVRGTFAVHVVTWG